MSTFTVNKNILQPAPGSFNNIWDEPVNANWEIIDASLGGTTSISVTGVTSGTYAFSTSQYQPPNIEFSGTIGGNLVYVLPAGVGGIWSISNATSGAFSLSFGVTGGNSISLAQGGRSIIVSDG